MEKEEKQVDSVLAKTKQIQEIVDSTVQMHDSEHATRKRANPFIHPSIKVTNFLPKSREGKVTEKIGYSLGVNG